MDGVVGSLVHRIHGSLPGGKGTYLDSRFLKSLNVMVHGSLAINANLTAKGAPSCKEPGLPQPLDAYRYTVSLHSEPN